MPTTLSQYEFLTIYGLQHVIHEASQHCEYRHVELECHSLFVYHNQCRYGCEVSESSNHHHSKHLH